MSGRWRPHSRRRAPRALSTHSEGAGRAQSGAWAPCFPRVTAPAHPPPPHPGAGAPTASALESARCAACSGGPGPVRGAPAAVPLQGQPERPAAPASAGTAPAAGRQIAPGARSPGSQACPGEQAPRPPAASKCLARRCRPPPSLDLRGADAVAGSSSALFGLGPGARARWGQTH